MVGPKGGGSAFQVYTHSRERVLFIGTQFSILYTSMYSPAEAATLKSYWHAAHYSSTIRSPSIETPKSEAKSREKKMNITYTKGKEKYRNK
jgi:hypothetical protein